MMKILPAGLLGVFALIVFPAVAQIASEVPLEDPQVLEAPSRSQGISEAPEAPVAPNVGEEDGLADTGTADQAEQETTENKTENGSHSGEMTFERLAEIVLALDQNAQVQGRHMLLTVQGVTIQVIADPIANRMRAFSPFQTLDGVDGQTLYRMMQANFDSALDARYSIAQGHLISTYIHPLRELRKEQFIEGLGQVVNLVLTFGTTYHSGGVTYGGGDSRDLHRQLIDDLLKKGEEI